MVTTAARWHHTDGRTSFSTLLGWALEHSADTSIQMGYGVVGAVWLFHLVLSWWSKTRPWVLGRLLHCLLDLEQKPSCLLNAYRGQHIDQSRTCAPSGPWFGRIKAKLNLVLIEIIAGSHWQKLSPKQKPFILHVSSWSTELILSEPWMWHLYAFAQVYPPERSLPLASPQHLGFGLLNFSLCVWISKEEFLLEVEDLSLFYHQALPPPRAGSPDSLSNLFADVN